MRLFVALEPPEDAVEHLDEFLTSQRAAGPGLRWSSPTQWHVTLAFMGSAPGRVEEEVVARVGDAAARTTPMTLSLTGGGCFPDAARAKVLWAGVGGSDAVHADLAGLARAVRAGCSVAGAGPEGGPFHPHVTLGRFGRAEDATRWVRVLDTYAGPSWRADEVTVVQSHLPRERRHRPRHEVLARLPLGG